MGDIVHLQDKPYQWANANEAMSILDGVVPYCFNVGNHDMVIEMSEPNSSNIIRDTTQYNKYFPYTRYENQPWYGGRMLDDGYPPTNDYDNAYFFFSACGMDFMIITMEVGPTDAMLAWADGIIDTHPNHRVIVMTHSYMDGNDTRDSSGAYLPSTGPANTGEQMWHKFVKKHKNIFYVFSGHLNNLDDHRGLLASTGDNGNTVYQLISGEDYDGWLRILKFVPSENKIYVKTYSPWKPDSPDLQFQQYGFSLPGYNKDQYHQYELEYAQ